MNNTVVILDQIVVRLKTGIDIVDITFELQTIIGRSNIMDGILNATITGSTGSITTIEFESGVVSDLKRAIIRLAPSDDEYEHEKAWHDGNGHSHVQAALLGPSITLPIRNGKLSLGTWQQAVVINHDNRKRDRKIEITIMGAQQE